MFAICHVISCYYIGVELRQFISIANQRLLVLPLGQLGREDFPCFLFFLPLFSAAGALVVVKVFGVSIHSTPSTYPTFCSEAHKSKGAIASDLHRPQF